VKENGFIAIQGGGNGLLTQGKERTVGMIDGLLKDIVKDYPLMSVAFIPVFPRMNTAREYDVVRKNVNEELRILSRMKRINTIEMGEGKRWEYYLGTDGVHLSSDGEHVLYREINRWLQAMKGVQSSKMIL
jgi:lysophospholipase L1-like esterase